MSACHVNSQIVTWYGAWLLYSQNWRVEQNSISNSTLLFTFSLPWYLSVCHAILAISSIIHLEDFILLSLLDPLFCYFDIFSLFAIMLFCYYSYLRAKTKNTTRKCRTFTGCAASGGNLLQQKEERRLAAEQDRVHLRTGLRDILRRLVQKGPDERLRSFSSTRLLGLATGAWALWRVTRRKRQISGSDSDSPAEKRKKTDQSRRRSGESIEWLIVRKNVCCPDDAEMRQRYIKG